MSSATRYDVTSSYASVGNGFIVASFLEVSNPRCGASLAAHAVGPPT